MGWSREELGEKIYEKASVINRIESGKMVPDLKLARKMEKTLNVVLIEKTDGIVADELAHKKIRGSTIGDIARIKKNWDNLKIQIIFFFILYIKELFFLFVFVRIVSL